MHYQMLHSPSWPPTILIPATNTTNPLFTSSNIYTVPANMVSLSTLRPIQLYKHLITSPIITTKKPTPMPLPRLLPNAINLPHLATLVGAVNSVTPSQTVLPSIYSNFVPSPVIYLLCWRPYYMESHTTRQNSKQLLRRRNQRYPRMRQRSPQRQTPCHRPRFP